MSLRVSSIALPCASICDCSLLKRGSTLSRRAAVGRDAAGRPRAAAYGDRRPRARPSTLDPEAVIPGVDRVVEDVTDGIPGRGAPLELAAIRTGVGADPEAKVVVAISLEYKVLSVEPFTAFTAKV